LLRQCRDGIIGLGAEVYNDWAWADFYAAAAAQAQAGGDWIGAAIYNDWSYRYDNAAWTLYNAAGC
jgi:hypothetical protein